MKIIGLIMNKKEAYREEETLVLFWVLQEGEVK